jgi:primosomal protein N' (replication factor Y)
MHTHPYILHLAIYKPIRHCFDYLLPLGLQIDPKTLQPGIRILVPFGKMQVVGVLLQVNQTACIPLDKLKPALVILDTQPIFTPAIGALYQWASQYYQHPIGEVILGTLPVALKRAPKIDVNQQQYAFTAAGAALDIQILSRTHRQAALWIFFSQHPAGVSIGAIQAAGFNKTLLRALLEKDWIYPIALPAFASPPAIKPLPAVRRSAQPPLPLHPEQQAAVTALKAVTGFSTFLLEGITGSGKTEVYLQVIAACLAQGKQALVLVPEIGLTPQTIARFEARFPVHIAALHSALSARARADAWLHAKEGIVRIVIGTRSAIFTPFAQLGIIILDEEHDASFKQQSGFRYSARDLAIMRGRIENLPVLLGTATPSLETVQNVHAGRFKLLPLKARAGNAKPPSFHLIDLRNKHLAHGLDATLITHMQTHLAHNNQVLLFLNRRGYAPVLLCHACGWSASCLRCDARLTLHHKPLRLICHHCTKTYAMCRSCGQCHGTELLQVGLGTERLEEGLRTYFPTTEIIRIDRDTVRHKDAMEKILDRIREGRKQILIGTQMLAKGHHFPNVTCVCIVDTDSGLYSTDFRATERMGQLILQVAGRAGRAEKPGQVFLQTHKPDHPLLQVLIQQGYSTFAQMLLEERKTGFWPPFSFLVLLRAEAGKEKNALHFLDQARDIAKEISEKKKGVQLLGPIPAPMERKAGHFRALLLFQAKERALLQAWLAAFVPCLEAMPKKGTVRWSLDVDPQDMG